HLLLPLRTGHASEPVRCGRECGSPRVPAVNWGTGLSENAGTRLKLRKQEPLRASPLLSSRSALHKRGVRACLVRVAPGRLRRPGLRLRLVPRRSQLDHTGSAMTIGMGWQAMRDNYALERSGARWTAHPKPDSRLDGRSKIMLCCAAGHSGPAALGGWQCPRDAALWPERAAHRQALGPPIG